MLQDVSSSAPFLLAPFQRFVANKDFPPHWRNLLRQLAKDSPAAGVQCVVSELELALDQFYSCTGKICLQ